MYKFYNRRFLAGGVAQVIQCLPNNCEALSSNPITTKKKKKKKERKKAYPSGLRFTGGRGSPQR
jgi:hypothetical protein